MNPNFEGRSMQSTNQTETMSPNNTVIPIGIDRIDQVAPRPLDGQYRHVYNGTGVTVYVIDTGIRTSHSEFEGRASCGFDYFQSDENSPQRCNDDDLIYGHGTHVAGTVGGRRAGVAKQVQLVAVKVFTGSGSGSFASVEAGMDYVLGQVKNRRVRGRAVVNMSLGGGFRLRTNLAVRRLVRHGIVVVVSAGNAASNACLLSPGPSRPVSPGSALPALTVASSEYSDVLGSDVLSDFSNYGRCIDIIAYVQMTLCCRKVVWSNQFSHFWGRIIRLLTQTGPSHCQCQQRGRYFVSNIEWHEHGGSARGGYRGALPGNASHLVSATSPQRAVAGCTGGPSRESRANPESTLVHWKS
jgi:Subtilase family